LVHRTKQEFRPASSLFGFGGGSVRDFALTVTGRATHTVF
jgi:hypothetical protein